jgi:hypothetical protein
MSKWFQATVDATGIDEIVSVQFDMEADLITSRVCGERVERLHGQKGKRITGTIVAESDLSSLWGTSVASMTITLLDETGGAGDLAIALGKTEFNQLGVQAGADDSNPVQFSLQFQSEVSEASGA